MSDTTTTKLRVCVADTPHTPKQIERVKRGGAPHGARLRDFFSKCCLRTEELSLRSVALAASILDKGCKSTEGCLLGAPP